MYEKVCRIVGAGDFSPEDFCNFEGDTIIAADGGYALLCDIGITPDITVGDFDSLGYKPEGALVHPCEKDDTDMLLAVKLGLERGCKEFFIYGGLGGRLSHTAANIQVLRYIAKQGGSGFLVGEGQIITVIENGSIGFSADCKGTLSVLTLSPTSHRVSICGAKYEVSNFEMTSDFPIGVSNEFDGRAASISVEDGTLLVIWEGKDTMETAIEI